jgi:hypothetical protein
MSFTMIFSTSKSSLFTQGLVSVTPCNSQTSHNLTNSWGDNELQGSDAGGYVKATS